MNFLRANIAILRNILLRDWEKRKREREREHLLPGNLIFETVCDLNLLTNR